MDNGNRYWLKQHQITAFWHGFGISNGFCVPKEMTKEIYIDKHGMFKDTPQVGGRVEIKISQEFMQQKLAEYIKWLEQYAKSWNDDDKHPFDIDTRDKFLEDEKGHESRANVLKMIELLQTYRIDDK